MLGICNGFQALIKLGLVPFGEIIDTDDDLPHPDLQHSSAATSPGMVRTRVASNQSPWLAGAQVGDIYTRPHLPRRGPLPGRRGADPASWPHNGQIATQYVDLDGHPTMDIDVQPQRLHLGRGGHHLPRRPRVSARWATASASAQPLPERPRGLRHEALPVRRPLTSASKARAPTASRRVGVLLQIDEKWFYFTDVSSSDPGCRPRRGSSPSPPSG